MHDPLSAMARIRAHHDADVVIPLPLESLPVHEPWDEHPDPLTGAPCYLLVVGWFAAITATGVVVGLGAAWALDRILARAGR